VSDILEKDKIISHCENLLKQIKDIVSAKIIADADGKISEIHVVSKPDGNPKQIIMDIESTLITYLGQEIDQKKISVTQLNNKNDELFANVNFRVHGISTHKTQQYLEVKVLLEDSEGNIFEGKAQGNVSFQSRICTTAYATIDAIQVFARGSFAISLDDVCSFNIGNNQAIAVLVSVLTGERAEQLLGCALIVNDIYETVVQAVLNAVMNKNS